MHFLIILTKGTILVLHIVTWLVMLAIAIKGCSLIITTTLFNVRNDIYTIRNKTNYNICDGEICPHYKRCIEKGKICN